jgi:hypothetical protein
MSKLDAETIRKLALVGARQQQRDLEMQVERVREVIRQLCGASTPRVPAGLPLSGKKKEKPHRKYRFHSDEFKAEVVKATKADNASVVSKQYKISPSLVRKWMKK